MADEKLTIELDLNTTKVKPALKTTEEVFKKSGKKSGKSFSSGFSSSIKSLAGSMFSLKGAILSIGAALGAAFATGKLIEAANTQEDAVKSLNTALQISGKYTQEASQELQDYASSLQLTTAVGDEVILKSQALIQSLGSLTTDGLKRATQASLDLSSALGIDLQSAATLVGKAAAGEVGSFSRYGVVVKKAANNAETFANALTALETKFGGAAAENAKTFSKRLDAVNNSFGDLQEELGFAITKSEDVNAGLVVLRKTFDQLITIVKGNATVIGALVRDTFVLLVKSIGTIVSASVNAINSFQALKLAWAKATNAILKGALRVVIQFEKLKGVLGLDNIAEDLVRNSSKIDQFFEARNKQSIAEFAKTTKRLNFLKNNIVNAVKEISKSGKVKVEVEKPTNISEKMNQIGLELSKSFFDGFSSASDTKWINAITDGLGKAATQSQKVAAVMNKAFVSIGRTANKAMGKGIASGFAAFGAALVQGENALEAFGKAMLGALGQAAVAEGTSMILRGTGYLFDPLLAGFGGPLIAAGAALATFGGALSAVVGGGAPATSGGAGGEVASSANTLDTDPIENISANKEAGVNITIEGNFFETEESNLRLVDMINSAIDGQNVKINQRAFA